MKVKCRWYFIHKSEFFSHLILAIDSWQWHSMCWTKTFGSLNRLFQGYLKSKQNYILATPLWKSIPEDE